MTGRAALWLGLAVASGCSGPDVDTRGRPLRDGSRDADSAGDTATCVDPQLWYRDEDGDGWGTDLDFLSSCPPAPEGYVADGGDCDDGEPFANPNTWEDCLTPFDDDCDGLPNNASEWYIPRNFTYYYRDEDGDGQGSAEPEAPLCAPKGLFQATLTGDCDDTDPTVFNGSPTCGAADDLPAALWFDSFQGGASGGHIPGEIADATGDGVPDLLVGLWLHAEDPEDDEDFGGAVLVVPGPIEGPVALDDPSVLRVEGGGALGSASSIGFTVNALPDEEDGRIAIGGASALWIGPSDLSRDAWWDEAAFVTSASHSLGALGASAARLDGGALLVGTGVGGAGAAFLVEPLDAGAYEIDEIAIARFEGEDEWDYAGACVAGAGDTDGDGVEDILIGAPYEGAGGSAYLVRGPFAGAMSLADADARLWADHVGAQGGCGLAGGADADGDGLDDLAVGAFKAWEEDGAAYLVRSPVSGTLVLADVATATIVGHPDPFDGATWAGHDLAWMSDPGGGADLVVGVPSGGHILDGYQSAVSIVDGRVIGVHRVGTTGRTLLGEAFFGAGLRQLSDGERDWLFVGDPGASPGGIFDAGRAWLIPVEELAVP